MKTVVAALIAVALWAGTAAWAQNPGEVVAAVNGEKITAADLYKALKARWGWRQLETLIGDMVVRQATRERHILVTAQEVEQRYNAQREKVHKARLAAGGPSWEQWLARQELTPEVYKERVEITLLMEKAVKDRVTVDDKEVEDFFNRNRHRLRRPESRRVSHIAVKTQEEIKQLRRQIVAGEKTFGDIAREKSLDPTTKEQGGDLGYILKGASPLQRAAFKLKAIGDISEPFQSELKLWHIVKLDDIKPAHEANFDELKDKIRQDIYNLKLRQQMTAWYQEQKDKARIERFGEFEIAPTVKATP